MTDKEKLIELEYSTGDDYTIICISKDTHETIFSDDCDSFTSFMFDSKTGKFVKQFIGY